MINNKDTGNKGEELAVNALLERGFNILERNWQFRHWEVDIIASLDTRLHFVEVKTRTNRKFGYPEESITRDKMQSLKNAAEAYLDLHKEWKYIQFDVAAITLNGDKMIDFLLIEDVYF
jgi:putative endonuclease